MDEDEDLERSVDLMVEQEEIVDCVNKIRDKVRGRGLSWNRFRGDAISKVLAHYLTKRVSGDIEVVRSAWVEDCGNEFDLLIVDKGVEPLEFTSAYPKDHVHLLIEVKGSGVFYKREEVKERLSKMFETWKNNAGKPVLYISIWEAKAHAEEVCQALGTDTAFILQIEGQDLNWGEWERFLERINALLKLKT